MPRSALRPHRGDPNRETATLHLGVVDVPLRTRKRTCRPTRSSAAPGSAVTEATMAKRRTYEGYEALDPFFHVIQEGLKVRQHQASLVRRACHASLAGSARRDRTLNAIILAGAS